MQAAVLTAPGRLDLVEQPEAPDPGPAEVLVAVRQVGICGTDYHAYRGTQNFIAYPCVLGHELAVEVLAVGSGVTGLATGERCAVLPYLSCGACPACRRGRTNCCERLAVLGVTRPGGLRERMVLPAAQLLRGAGLTLDQLVLVETLGIGWHAVARSRPEPYDRVLVLGAGPIGLAVAQSVRHRVERLVIADTSAERIEFAAASGLDTIGVHDDFPAAVRDRFDGVLPSVVFDASGSRASMEAAFGYAGTGGKLVLVGHTTGPLTFHNPGFHARELTVLASRNATPADCAEVIRAIHDGVLDPVSWLNYRTTLRSVVDDLPRLATNPGRVVKAVIHIGPAPDAAATRDGG